MIKVCSLLEFINEYHDKFKKSFDFAKSCILHTSLSTQKISKALKIIEENYSSQKNSNPTNRMSEKSNKKREKLEKVKSEKKIKGNYSSIKKVKLLIRNKTLNQLKI